MYDITLTGSIVQSKRDVNEALECAAEVSKGFPGRLLRVHGIDGVSVIAEYRNGVAEFLDLVTVSL